MARTTNGEWAREFHDGPVQRLAMAMVLLGKIPTRRADGRYTRSGAVLEQIRSELLAVASGMAHLELLLTKGNTMYKKGPCHADDINESL